jgi:hypothetical protein
VAHARRWSPPFLNDEHQRPSSPARTTDRTLSSPASQLRDELEAFAQGKGPIKGIEDALAKTSDTETVDDSEGGMNIDPREGIMCGRCVAAKNRGENTKKMLGMLGSKQTKHRYYTLDGAALRWCVARSRSAAGRGAVVRRRRGGRAPRVRGASPPVLARRGDVLTRSVGPRQKPKLNRSKPSETRHAAPPRFFVASSLHCRPCRTSSPRIGLTQVLPRGQEQGADLGGDGRDGRGHGRQVGV